MARNSPKTTFILDADTKKLDQKLDKTGKKLQDTGEKGFTAFKLKLLAGIGAATAALAAFFNKVSDWVDAASELEESTSKFNVVFGDVAKQAEIVRKELTSAYGLSRIEAVKLLSATGDLLTGFGFTGKAALDVAETVNKLAVDLASFTNAQGGAEAVSNALTKALLGETESLKTYGIAIRQADIQTLLLEKGLDKLTGTALSQAKAQATLEIALSQSKNAIGDYARTADGFANVQRQMESDLSDLTATMGNKFLPAAKDLSKTVSKLAKDFDEWLRENDPTVIDEMTDSAAAQLVQFDQLSGQYEILAQQTELTAGEQELLAETVATLQRQYPNYLKNVNFEADGYEAIAKALKEARDNLDDYLKKKIQEAVLAEQEEKFIALGKTILEIQKNRVKRQVEINQVMEQGSRTINGMTFETDKQARTMAELNMNVSDLTTTLEEDFVKQQEQLKADIQETTDAINELFGIEPPTTIVTTTKEQADAIVILNEALAEQIELTYEQIEADEELDEQMKEDIKEQIALIRERQEAESDAAKDTQRKLNQSANSYENFSAAIGETLGAGLAGDEFKESLKQILGTTISFIQKTVLAAQVAAGARAVFGDFSGLIQIAAIQAIFETLKVAVASFRTGGENIAGGLIRVEKDETIGVPPGSAVFNKRETTNTFGDQNNAQAETNQLLKQLINVSANKKIVIKRGDIVESYDRGAKDNLRK